MYNIWIDVPGCIFCYEKFVVGSWKFLNDFVFVYVICLFFSIFFDCR